MNRNQIAAALTASAMLAVGLWGGMLNDRHIMSLDFGGTMGLVGVPLVASLAALALAVLWWDIDDTRWKPCIAGVAAGALGAWSGISLLRSHNVSASLTTTLILVGSLTASACAYRLARQAATAWLLIMTLVISVAIISALGLGEYAVHAGAKDILWRVFATFSMPNFLSGFLVMLVPVAAGVFLGSNVRMVTALAAMTLALSAACLLLTQSRFGLLVMFVAAIAFAILAIRTGVLRGHVRNRFLFILAIGLIAAAFFAKPVVHRLLGSETESYSSRFRTLTWRGTLEMIKDNAILGTGIGTFDTAYAPYARVGFTEHAHNGYLQFAAETGIPGALLLIVCLAAPLFTGFRGARRLEEVDGVPFNNRLLVAGLTAGLTGAIIRNFFDSDLYVPANAITLSVIAGLIVGMVSPGALRMEPESSGQPKRKVAKPPNRAATPSLRVLIRRTVSIALVLWVMLVSARTAVGRIHASNSFKAMLAQEAQPAIEEIEAAVARDGTNPDYHLNLAELRSRTGDFTGADQEYHKAIDAAPIGKCYFRYGKFLITQSRVADAISAFERAAAIDPNYPQNLLYLADAYKAGGKPHLALRTYERMVRLYCGPVGQLRAVPEQVPWEFGFAYFGLAEDQLVKGDRRAAIDNLREGKGIMANFWDRRADGRNMVRPDQWEKITSKYDWALQQFSAALRSDGKLGQATVVDADLAKFRTELQEANAQRQKEQAPDR